MLSNSLAAHFTQQRVASRAARECAAVRVDREVAEDFTELLPNPLGGEVEHVGRGSQPLVASQNKPPIVARGAEQFGSADHFIESDVDPAQPQPPSQARKHPVSG